MDAAEIDADVKLYRASDRLLRELRAKLPLLVRRSSTDKRHVRGWVLKDKPQELVHIVSIRVSSKKKKLIRVSLIRSKNGHSF